MVDERHLCRPRRPRTRGGPSSRPRRTCLVWSQHLTVPFQYRANHLSQQSTTHQRVREGNINSSFTAHPSTQGPNHEADEDALPCVCFFTAM